MKHIKVPVECLVITGNPRTDRTEQAVQKMMGSILEMGLEEAIKVVELPGNKFHVESGGTRAEAVTRLAVDHAEWKYVDVMVYDKREYEDEKEELAVTICRRTGSNVGRTPMSPIDEGREFNLLFENCGWGIDRIARAMARDVPYIQSRLDIYRQPVARNAFQDGTLNAVSDGEKLVALTAYFEQEAGSEPMLHEVGAIIAYYEKHNCLNPRWLDDLIDHYHNNDIPRDPMAYDAWLSKHPEYADVYSEYCWGSLLADTERTVRFGTEKPYEAIRNKLKYGKPKSKTTASASRNHRDRIWLACALQAKKEGLNSEQILQELRRVYVESRAAA